MAGHLERHTSKHLGTLLTFMLAEVPARCQVLAEEDWAREHKLPRPTLICFETGRRSQTQSSVEALIGLRQQMDVWF
jgi:hypothetical protein